MIDQASCEARHSGPGVVFWQARGATCRSLVHGAAADRTVRSVERTQRHCPPARSICPGGALFRRHAVRASFASRIRLRVCACKCGNRASPLECRNRESSIHVNPLDQGSPALLVQTFQRQLLSQAVTRSHCRYRAPAYRWICSPRISCLWCGSARTMSGNTKRQCGLNTRLRSPDRPSVSGLKHCRRGSLASSAIERD